MRLINALQQTELRFSIKAVVLDGQVYLYARKPKYEHDWFYADEAGQKPLPMEQAGSDRFEPYSPDVHEAVAKEAFPNHLEAFSIKVDPDVRPKKKK